MTKGKEVCPHCGEKMKQWKTPTWSTWGGEIRLVCFNDDCPYYVRGWDWMRETRNVKCSYRHSVDPATGAGSPIPVTSSSACREGIIED
ncbi:MAG: ogr/Delta-like zinc finger family protein [Deltaproteobacteria bacterium]|nr:ogr/Delta-like zinc finger family protein [Deltaproteobacteria bacterium]